MTTRSATRFEAPPRHGSRVLAVSILLAALVWLPSRAHALGVQLVPVGGSATGLVGETLTVGIDLIVEDGEFVTIADPVLAWDLEGGNVLDVVSAQQAIGLSMGGTPFNPIASDRWVRFDPRATSNEELAASETSYLGTQVIPDSQPGPTALWGFEMSSFFFDEDVLEFFEDGISEAGSHRIGAIEFLLQEVGTTTVTYVTTENIAFTSLFAGRELEWLPNDEIDLRDLEVSAGGLVSLQIRVVPEPGAALMIGLGLFGLGMLRRR